MRNWLHKIESRQVIGHFLNKGCGRDQLIMGGATPRLLVLGALSKWVEKASHEEEAKHHFSTASTFLLPHSCPVQVPALTASDDELLYGRESETNTFLPSCFCSQCFIAAIETMIRIRFSLRT